jgi:hypothetical protein
MTDISSLPKEMLSLVMSFLGDDTKLAARLACTQWFKQIRYSNFELDLIRDDQWPSIAARLSQYDIPISITFSYYPERKLENLMGPLTTLTNLESLTLGSINKHCQAEDWLKLTCLTKLTYLYCLGTKPQPELFSKMTWLRNFSADGALAMDTKHLIPKWTNLEELFFCYEGVYDVFEIVKFSSRLTRLDLNYTACQGIEEENTKALSNLRSLSLYLDTVDGDGDGEVSLRHMTALEYLEISHPFRSLASSRLTELSLFGTATKSISVNSASLSNLRTLDITFSSDDAELSISTLQSLTALETLKLHFSPNEDFNTIYNNITATNLTRLYLREWTIPEPINITSLNSLVLSYKSDTVGGDLSLLTNLTHLSVASNDNKPLELTGLTKIKSLLLFCSSTAVDFHQLKDLVLLDISLSPQQNLTGLETATGLTRLRIFSDNNLVVDFGFIQNLTLLKEIHASRVIGRNFWQNLRCLTNLKTLEFPRVYLEEQVLLLTTLRNLRVFSTTAQTLHGRYLTLLTSLQTLHFFSDLAAKAISTEKLYSSLTRLISHRFA